MKNRLKLIVLNATSEISHHNINMDINLDIF